MRPATFFTTKCVECITSFDCTDPTKPTCDNNSCSAASECTDDDAFEDKDDSPFGATDITPVSGDKSSATGHSICGIPDSEADYFSFVASDGDDVTKRNEMGLDLFSNPSEIKLATGKCIY